MHKWIVPLSPDLPEHLVGRKAAALGRLIGRGFPIPAGWCIPTSVYPLPAQARMEKINLPAGLVEELTEAFQGKTPLAVRSSAVLEDRPDASLAGRYSTYLNVSGPAALERAILGCWSSFLSAPGEIEKGGMAILVQPMLEAECAGVCFTIDPVRLKPDLLLISSAWGLGAGVVGGLVPADTTRLRRADLTVDDISIAQKHIAMHSAPANMGIMPVSVPDNLQTIACLPESWLQRVGQFGLAIEQVFEAPQDIEWAIMGGQLWILQSRPVTALPPEIRDAARFPVGWDNEEEPWHYWWLERSRDKGDPLLPAELDFIRFNTRGGHDAVYFGGAAMTRWRKAINGRVYMAAAKSPHSQGHVRVYGTAAHELNERLRRQDITSWEYWGPEIVSATARLGAFDARGADGPTLAGHLEDALATSIRHWMIHTMISRPIRSAALLDLYARLTGLPEEEAASEIPFLLAGTETVQTQLVEALYELASQALGSPETAQAVALGSQADAAGDSPGMASFVFAYRGLMVEYGSRVCYQPIPGFPVELPLPWREAPQYVWKLIAAYLPLASQGGPSPRESRLVTKRRAEERIEALCEAAMAAGAEPALIEDFRQELAYARRNAISLDEHNHFIDQLTEGQYYQALLDTGRWLADKGCLTQAFDVYWLTAEEIMATLLEPSDRLEIAIQARRKQFAEWQELIPPACLGLPDPSLPDRPSHSQHAQQSWKDPAGIPANTLIGEPASRGRAEGRARLIGRDTSLDGIAPGDILVASFAELAFIPFLPATAAIVLDQGGPGDHFAITAREFGLPAVCATRYATRLIPEGAKVIVDADQGLVTWMDIN